jgi:hypothetical protein
VIPAPRPVAPIRILVHTTVVGDTPVTITKGGTGYHAYVDVGDEVLVIGVPDASDASLRFAAASVLQ